MDPKDPVRPPSWSPRDWMALIVMGTVLSVLAFKDQAFVTVWPVVQPVFILVSITYFRERDGGSK